MPVASPETSTMSLYLSKGGGAEMPEFDKDYVLKTVEEKKVKFIRLWFTDVLGYMKSFAITVDELEGALDEGMGFDGSSIEGFARIEESDMIAMPDPTHLRDPAVAADRGRRRRAHVLRRAPAGRHALRRRPPLRPEEEPEEGRRPGLHLLRRPGAGVLLLQERPGHRVPRLRRLLRPDRRWTSPATCAATPSWRWRRWASTSSTAITRWPPASTRSTCATPRP